MAHTLMITANTKGKTEALINKMTMKYEYDQFSCTADMHVWGNIRGNYPSYPLAIS